MRATVAAKAKEVEAKANELKAAEDVEAMLASQLKAFAPGPADLADRDA